MELYSHKKYKGYHLFVEVYDDEDSDEVIYEGVAQHNGTTIYQSKSYISGDKAEDKLIEQINKEVDNETAI